MIGKWLVRAPHLLILDEPTIGVDIGAKSEIVDTVRAMADKGTAVLVISSELEELMAISDRILVLHGGRIAQSVNRRDVATEEELHHAIKATATLRPSAALPKVQLQNYVVYIFFAVVLGFFAITIGDKGFLSVMNLFNIARTTAMVTVIAVAMTLSFLPESLTCLSDQLPRCRR